MEYFRQNYYQAWVTLFTVCCQILLKSKLLLCFSDTFKLAARQWIMRRRKQRQTFQRMRFQLHSFVSRFVEQNLNLQKLFGLIVKHVSLHLKSPRFENVSSNKNIKCMFNQKAGKLQIIWQKHTVNFFIREWDSNHVIRIKCIVG